MENVLSSAHAERNSDLNQDDAPNREKARATRARQRAIGRELRRFYDEVISEPVPDEFLDLLRKIDDASPHSDEASKKNS